MTRGFAVIAGMMLLAAPAWSQQPVSVPLTAPPPAAAVAQAPAPAPAAAVAATPAQVAPVPAAPAAAAPETPAPADDPAVRLDLAKKLQVLMPAGPLLESVIATQSQSLPDNDRAAFRERILKAIDQKRLEALSVKTLADLFSVAELKRMLDYFGSPEARFIAQKMQAYQNMLQPEIAKMLDNALMEVRPENATAPTPAKN